MRRQLGLSCAAVGESGLEPARGASTRTVARRGLASNVGAVREGRTDWGRSVKTRPPTLESHPFPGWQENAAEYRVRQTPMRTCRLSVLLLLLAGACATKPETRRSTEIKPTPTESKPTPDQLYDEPYRELSETCSRILGAGHAWARAQEQVGVAQSRAGPTADSRQLPESRWCGLPGRKARLTVRRNRPGLSPVLASGTASRSWPGVARKMKARRTRRPTRR